MSNRKMALAGSLWVALLGGCASETQTIAPSAAAYPVVTNPSLPTVMPRLGAGDPLGQQIFPEGRLASGTPRDSATAGIAE